MGHEEHFVPADTSKVSKWRCFHISDSNLNSVSSFIIPIRSHLNGPAAMGWTLWSKCPHIILV
eukprot:scaffold10711_cov73-Cyclotella_meneghiniana.AAC.1